MRDDGPVIESRHGMDRGSMHGRWHVRVTAASLSVVIVNLRSQQPGLQVGVTNVHGPLEASCISHVHVLVELLSSLVRDTQGKTPDLGGHFTPC